MEQNNILFGDLGARDITNEVRREEALLKAGALQNAIFNSANFSSIATDEKGVIQIFNVGAERMLGYAAAEVINQITPADISDPQEVIARAKALSAELATPITPGFEALVFKASRAIEDIYELTYIRKDGSRFPAVVSVTALRGDDGGIIGYLLIGTDNSARKRAEEALLKAHKELVEASRRAGMAEVATGILHNVGNVLNSVNVASSCLADSLRKSKASNLSKVVAMLRPHEGDVGDYLISDPTGQQVLSYLAQLAEHLAGEKDAALKALAQLQKNIEHIKEIVSMQQSFAKVSGLVETLQVTDLVKDALRMNSSAFARHGIEVVTEFEDVPPVAVEKHKVLQILVNLVRNSKHACDDSGRSDKRLTLRVSNGRECVRIAVTDNGIGIPAENLTRIFNHGFSTKRDGHGFGLHSGALAAREMGGSLIVHSDGPGHGAAFTLELPCLAPENFHE